MKNNCTTTSGNFGIFLKAKQVPYDLVIKQLDIYPGQKKADAPIKNEYKHL